MADNGLVFSSGPWRSWGAIYSIYPKPPRPACCKTLLDGTRNWSVRAAPANGPRRSRLRRRREGLGWCSCAAVSWRAAARRRGPNAQGDPDGRARWPRRPCDSSGDCSVVGIGLLENRWWSGRARAASEHPGETASGATSEGSNHDHPRSLVVPVRGLPANGFRFCCGRLARLRGIRSRVARAPPGAQTQVPLKRARPPAANGCYAALQVEREGRAPSYTWITTPFSPRRTWAATRMRRGPNASHERRSGDARREGRPRPDYPAPLLVAIKTRCTIAGQVTLETWLSAARARSAIVPLTLPAPCSETWPRIPALLFKPESRLVVPHNAAAKRPRISAVRFSRLLSAVAEVTMPEKPPTYIPLF